LYYTASGIVTPVGGRPVRRLREDWLLLVASCPSVLLEQLVSDWTDFH